MRFQERKVLLASIKEVLAKKLELPTSASVENIGSVFFICGKPFMPFREFIERVNSVFAEFSSDNFSVLDMDAHYFVGGYSYAEKLFVIFGGDYKVNGQAGNGSYLWQSAIYDHDVWEDALFDEKSAVERATPLDKEEVIAFLF